MFASIKVDKEYSKNQIFDIGLNDKKFDGRGYKYIKLREQFLKKGIQLNTHDIYTDYSKVSFTIFLDAAQFDKRYISKKNYLIVIEPDSIHKKNNSDFSRKFYDKIFTWQDNLLDNKKYFKYNFSYNLNINEQLFFKNKIKKAVMVASKKNSSHKNELYSKREEIINWYNENKFKHFDLYGRGWDRFKFKIYPLKYLNRFEKLSKIMSKTIFYNNYENVYKGKIDNKLDLISNYQFCYCLENIKNIKGYITEKIFDSFFSGTIPIYKGADNVLQYIPQDTFINLDSFKSLSELDNYLMNNCDVEFFRKNILEFLKSNAVQKFDSLYNAKKISNEIMKDVF